MDDNEITHKIIGFAMKIHNTLGNGFQEVIYQRCMLIELERHRFSFEREKEMPIFYNKIQVGTRRVDFLVENRISVEFKAIIRLDDTHFAQAMNYLEAYNLKTGLLINFGGKSLEFKRLYKKMDKL